MEKQNILDKQSKITSSQKIQNISSICSVLDNDQNNIELCEYSEQLWINNDMHDIEIILAKLVAQSMKITKSTKQKQQNMLGDSIPIKYCENCLEIHSDTIECKEDRYISAMNTAIDEHTEWKKISRISDYSDKMHDKIQRYVKRFQQILDKKEKEITAIDDVNMDGYNSN